MNRRITSLLSIALLVGIVVLLTGCASTNKGQYFKTSRKNSVYMYEDRIYNPEDYRYHTGE